jgi:flavin reductase (DIM6/NTAB) family NADH-FMN oxidoreductase RutF
MTSSTSVIHPDEFRRLCSFFATGVTIVTARHANGDPAGMTASSFASVSLDPPLVSIVVDHAATILPAMLAAKEFTINILSAEQETLSRRFASGLDERFDGVGWERGARDQVLLTGALAHICCAKYAEIPAGDHTIFLGEVLDGSSRHGRPLLHYRGGYADLEQP